MHYELYLDSLFLLNFGMNLLLLLPRWITAWATLPRGTGCLREPWSERSGICFLFMERNSRREAVALFSAGDNTYAVCDISHSQPWDVVELFPKTDAVHLPDRRHSGGTASGFPMGRNYMPGIGMTLGSRSILRLDTCVGAQKGSGTILLL